MTRWAITGGGGYWGRALAGRLRESEQDVQILKGDICDSDALAALVRGADVVVHLAAYVHKAARTPAEIAECERVNVGGTHALIDAIAAHAPDALLVFASSASVYTPSDEVQPETAPCEPVTVYGRTKLEGEALVLAAQRSGRIRACILRPAIIFGPGAPGNLGRLAQLAGRGWLVRFPGHPALKSLLPVETAVDAILAVAEQPELANSKIFNVTGGPPLAMAEIGALLATAFGKKARKIVVPRGPVMFAAALADGVLRFLPLRAPALGQLIASYAANAVLDDTLLRETFGFRPRIAVPDAIVRTFQSKPFQSKPRASAGT